MMVYNLCRWYQTYYTFTLFCYSRTMELYIIMSLVLRLVYVCTWNCPFPKEKVYVSKSYIGLLYQIDTFSVCVLEKKENYQWHMYKSQIITSFILLLCTVKIEWTHENVKHLKKIVPLICVLKQHTLIGGSLYRTKFNSSAVQGTGNL